jgi:hypothetical protein
MMDAQQVQVLNLTDVLKAIDFDQANVEELFQDITWGDTDMSLLPADTVLHFLTNFEGDHARKYVQLVPRNCFINIK